MTNIKDIGGEFALIDRVVKKIKNKNILVGPGDDCAVIKMGDKKLLLTVDALVENDHFNLKWSTPKQIGKKAIEVNVSDITSMGGSPKYALISLVLKKDTQVEFVDKLYDGIYETAKKYDIQVIGGNMTHGNQIVVDVSMIGEAGNKILTRDAAQPGDFILVSGDLGASTAGLRLFQNNVKGHAWVKQKHLEPEAKPNKVLKFSKYINAMLDISDGLASEINHICKQSKTGAIIFKDNIPIRDETSRAAEVLGNDALDYALFGGEDFELVFTVPEKYLYKVSGFLVGEITKEKGVYIYSKGKQKKLSRKGFDHFY